MFKSYTTYSDEVELYLNEILLDPEFKNDQKYPIIYTENNHIELPRHLFIIEGNTIFATRYST